jgi:hypothetical protein
VLVLSGIVELRLDRNAIAAIPPDIARLRRLQELSMVRGGWGDSSGGGKSCNFARAVSRGLPAARCLPV